jgi:hypothetical protein
MRKIFLGLMLTIITISNIHSVEAKPKVAPVVESSTEEVVSEEVVSEEVPVNSEEANYEEEQEVDSMESDNFDQYESQLDHNEIDEDLEMDESFDENDDSWIEDSEEDQEDF